MTSKDLKQSIGDWRWAIVLLGLTIVGIMILWLGTDLWGKSMTTRPQATALEGMVYIPGGEFLMGSTGREAKVGFQIGVDETPQHQISVKPFYIDIYEVTNAQYQKFIEATGRPTPVDHHDPMFYSWVGGRPPVGQENHPVVYVSWYDADAYCRWTGKHLPTEAEWAKAARGPDGRA
ncbi:MAG: formylglycine-generating enzyme family protein, partial [Nitrospira sp.]|nr:formylglycine-generating enzyme family protein [Nitrospira sp.]